MGQTEAWERIERWLSSNATEIAVGLQPPATREAIAITEDLLGTRLPEDVREAYLRHDGQAPGSPWFMYGWEWLSLARVRDEWSVWKGLLDDGVFEDNWSEGDATLSARTGGTRVGFPSPSTARETTTAST